MKLVGVSVASLALTRCSMPLPVSCYAPLPPPTPILTDRDRLRNCWLRFNELASTTAGKYEQGEELVRQLSTEHRALLDGFVQNGELNETEANLVQEAYDAALYHIWRSNAPITCYEPVMVDYAPVSAGILVHQAKVLDGLAGQGSIDPATLEAARAAIEHDLAFYALSDEEVDQLYERILAEWQSQGGATPSFEQVELEVTPEVRLATEFILGLFLQP
jgi:hypothetical protein